MYHFTEVTCLFLQKRSLVRVIFFLFSFRILTIAEEIRVYHSTSWHLILHYILLILVLGCWWNTEMKNSFSVTFLCINFEIINVLLSIYVTAVLATKSNNQSTWLMIFSINKWYLYQKTNCVLLEITENMSLLISCLVGHGIIK